MFRTGLPDPSNSKFPDASVIWNSVLVRSAHPTTGVLGGTIVNVRVTGVLIPTTLVALRVTLVVPITVGVPVITPVAVFKLRYPGNPMALKLVGLLSAVMVYENGLPTCPNAVRELVMVGTTTGITASVRVALPVPLLLVAVRVTGVVVAVVGVPLIAPVAAFTARPAGNRLAPNFVGLLVAVMEYENAVPTRPVAVRVLVICGADELLASSSAPIDGGEFQALPMRSDVGRPVEVPAPSAGDDDCK